MKLVLIVIKYARKKLFTYSKHGIIPHLQLGWSGWYIFWILYISHSIPIISDLRLF